jgi:Holliday junction DNA helicase RuvB
VTTRTIPILEDPNYPRRWSDYVGQERAKKVLQVAAKSARVRQQPLPHTLISHPNPGIGKTALAVLIAAEMKRNVKVVSGVLYKDKARMLLDTMEDRDVLLWDEAHQMVDAGKKNAEWLLSYLQDGIIFGPLGPEVQPKVSIVAATTDPGKIPDNIMSRFTLRPPMEEYDEEQAAKIAIKMSAGVLDGLPPLRMRDALRLAKAGNCNPRAILQLVTVLRDLHHAEENVITESGRYDIDALLEFQGITEDGLDLTAQRYLQALATEFAGSAGAKAMEDRLQAPGGLGTTERVLMNAGLIGKTRTGRTLTQAGIRRFRELQEAS